jgi:hypothetical protein
MKSPDEQSNASEATPPSEEGTRPEAESWGLFSRCPRHCRHIRGRRQAGDPRNRSKLRRPRGCHTPPRFERKL